ncbi:MAG: hypothetical protein R2856_38010 [Caldilineaceae bacterium]
MQKIRDIGYKSVQVSAIGPIAPADVKQILNDNGLTVWYHPHRLPRLQEDLDAVIEEHHLWQCKHVAVGSMPAEYREGGEDAYLRFAAEASAIGEKPTPPASPSATTTTAL